jgi:hypothetical protein
MPGRTVHLAFSIALLLLAQGAARAASLQWEGTFSFQFLGGLPSFQAEGGGIASVNASSGGLPAHLSTLRLAGSRHNLSLAEVRPITDPDVVDPGINLGLVVTATPGTGTFSAISGGAASTAPPGARALPVRGLIRLQMLTGPEAQGQAGAASDPDASFTWVTVNGATAGVGVGGRYYSQTTGTYLTFITSFIHTLSSGTVPWRHTTPAYEIRQLSIQGAPWTIKTATASGVYPPFFDGNDMTTLVTATRRGFAHAPASTTTSTAQIGGMLQMVTPMQVRWDSWYERPGDSWSHQGFVYSGFGVLTIRFIPEPGIGLLLATGLAGLVAIGRRRMRR